MKPLNALAIIAITVTMSAGLIGCGKTSNSSPSASTPATQCVANAYGQLVYSGTNTPCSTGSMTCPVSGYYQNSYGQMTQCVPGQVISGVYNYQYPGQYPYTPYPTNTAATGCAQYSYQYGVPYVPVYISNQLYCVRYDLIANQASYNQNYYNTGYYDYGYDYYYAYPPYSGSGCNTTINFGYNDPYSPISGNIGLCF